MKKTFLILGVTMAGLLIPAIVSRVSAQLEKSLVGKIPFAFTVCDKKLPAGKYTVKHPPGTTHTLVVQGEDNRSVDIACVKDLRSPTDGTEGKLIFNRYGDEYFLAEAWWPGESHGHEIVKTDRENALIKESPESAAKAKKRERVTIKLVAPGKR